MTTLRDLSLIRAEIRAVVVYPPGYVVPGGYITEHLLGTAQGRTYQELTLDLNDLFAEIAHTWPDVLAAGVPDAG